TSAKRDWSPDVCSSDLKNNPEEKPKAIIVVHLYGMPAKMGPILRVANKYNIPVIEDAAEALGSSIDGKRCGSFGRLSALSFNGRSEERRVGKARGQQMS